MFKKLLATIAVAGTAVVGFLGGQLKGTEDAINKWKAENLAAFVDTCPYIKTNVADYRRAWHQHYPYAIAIKWFSENQRQYYPELTPDLAKQCFAEPVKG